MTRLPVVTSFSGEFGENSDIASAVESILSVDPGMNSRILLMRHSKYGATDCLSFYEPNVDEMISVYKVYSESLGYLPDGKFRIIAYGIVSCSAAVIQLREMRITYDEHRKKGRIEVLLNRSLFDTPRFRQK